MKFIAYAAFAASICGFAISAHADPVPSVPDMVSEIQGIYSDFSDPEIRSVVAQGGNMHFMTLKMSLKPVEDVPGDMRDLQATISDVLESCADGFDFLHNSIGTSKEVTAWQLATSCLDRQDILEALSMGEFHGGYHLDPKPYAYLADLMEAKVSDVLPDF